MDELNRQVGFSACFFYKEGAPDKKTVFCEERFILFFQLPDTLLDNVLLTVYDQASGNLYVDKDGTGSAAPVLVAHLDPGTLLTADDIIVG